MKTCESCGMPMSADPENGGSEKDGSRSDRYCSYCYGDGAFLQPDISAEEMRDFCYAKMREQGFWRPVAWILTRKIPKLPRWT
ncbi:zinc ribbon domain-containing protein [Celeribacter arenosi]|uniref:Putative zinc ribbon domain-containing protein n=1 Tax=Celeribacter arenosi TaxID=792649 RepID=A0ABP7KG71_9RHOB